MIYAGKTTSVKNIIAKVYQDLGLKEEEDFISFIEWSAEALEKIGAFTQLETKTEPVVIKNYKGDLPGDVVYFNQIDFNGTPLIKDTNTLGVQTNDITSTANEPYAFYEAKIQNKVFADTGLNNNSTTNLPEYSFQIKNGYIKTSFQDGVIYISYQALPIDDEGYPLVPDYDEFRDALYWYINMKYTYKLWRTDQVRDAIYQDAKNEWNWHCQAAANKAMIPDLNTMENLKRSFLSLKPNTEQFKNFFQNLNRPTTH